MRAFRVVDVFSDRPFRGNPVAVVLNAQGMSGDEMQAVARWTNLSETTFVLPMPGEFSHYRLRIFTPGGELPFAGHPTLGSAHALLEAGVIRPEDGRVTQHCGVGPVSVEVGAGPGNRALSFNLPDASHGPLPGRIAETLEAALGAPVLTDAPPLRIDVGPVWIVAEATSREDLLRLQPDMARLRALSQAARATGVTLFAGAPGSADVETRSFAPAVGVDEDPVCGSGNGAAAVFRRLRLGAGAGAMRYEARQGAMTGREGRVSIAWDDSGSVSVGGRCVTSIEGRIRV